MPDSGISRIPESSTRRRFVHRRLIAAFLISALAHLILVLLIALFFHRPEFTGPPILRVARLTTLRIVQRSRPPAPRHVERAQPVKAAPAAPQSAPAPREIARIDRRALRPLPPKARYARNAPYETQLQQEQFEKTIARLREANNPVIGAERAQPAPSAEKHYAYNFSAGIGTVGSGQGILDVLQSWQADGYDYYYVKYWVEYPDGTTESGIVPWPIRYSPDADPFKLGIHHMPLPSPLADYTLPPGTVLHPLVAFCFKHRDELSDCPIQHD